MARWFPLWACLFSLLAQAQPELLQDPTAPLSGATSGASATGQREDDAHRMDDDVGEPLFAASLGVPVGVDRLGTGEGNVSAHIRLPFLAGAWC